VTSFTKLIHKNQLDESQWEYMVASKNPGHRQIWSGIAPGLANQCILADALLDVTTQEMQANLAATRCGKHCRLQDVTMQHFRDETQDSH